MSLELVRSGSVQSDGWQKGVPGYFSPRLQEDQITDRIYSVCSSHDNEGNSAIKECPMGEDTDDADETADDEQTDIAGHQTDDDGNQTDDEPIILTMNSLRDGGQVSEVMCILGTAEGHHTSISPSGERVGLPEEFSPIIGERQQNEAKQDSLVETTFARRDAGGKTIFHEVRDQIAEMNHENKRNEVGTASKNNTSPSSEEMPCMTGILKEQETQTLDKGDNLSRKRKIDETNDDGSTIADASSKYLMSEPSEIVRVKRIRLVSSTMSSPPPQAPIRRSIRVKLTFPESQSSMKATKLPRLKLRWNNIISDRDTHEKGEGALMCPQENNETNEEKMKYVMRSEESLPPYCYCEDCAEARRSGLLPPQTSPHSVKELRTEDQEELRQIEMLEKRMHEPFRRNYYMLKKLGSGAFSRVFVAMDLKYPHYENPWDVDYKGKQQYRSKAKRNMKFVAIKVVNGTTQPRRIKQELEFLREVSGNQFVTSIITADRCNDEVLIVLPYYHCYDIKDLIEKYYSLKMVRTYMYNLLSALEFTSRKGIIHRDVKPSNFLYNVKTGRGVLVDFGLAEWASDGFKKCYCQTGGYGGGRFNNSNYPKVLGGYKRDDNRPTLRKNRAGTRGYRAPEVLLQCGAQDPKIDVWSAGVLMLGLLSGKTAFFIGETYRDALIEQATIYGDKKMRRCAMLHGFVFEHTLPTISEGGFDFHDVVKMCRKVTTVTSQEESEAIDLVSKIMEIDVRKRIPAAVALQHPFFKRDIYLA